METSPKSKLSTPVPRNVAVGIVTGWMLIAIKCALTPYVITRWAVPVDPGWVIVPTLIFAIAVSLLVITHDWALDED